MNRETISPKEVVKPSDSAHGGDIYCMPEKTFLDLSSNVNFMGLPDGVKKAIIDNINTFDRYPDPQSRRLKKALSEHHAINEDMIVCGNGAADIIYRVVIALNPSKALVTAPTFSEYEEALSLWGCSTEKYELDEDNGFKLDEGIFDRITLGMNMLFICNPNNPTGIVENVAFMKHLAKVCSENATVLVVDECFMDFVMDKHKYSLLPFIKELSNTIILKAFTKTYAMAGLRLGYCITSPDIAKKISGTLQPWSVSSVAEVSGISALKETQYVENSIKAISQSRQYLIEKLSNTGFTVFESKTNYILFKCNIDNLCERLLEYNILLRACTNFYGLNKYYYRVAVKSLEDSKYFMECLYKIMENKWQQNQ